MHALSKLFLAGLLGVTVLSACTAECPEGTWCAGLVVAPDGGPIDLPDGGSLDLAASATGRIGPDGGTVSLQLTDGVAELVIPAGALTEETEILVGQTHDAIPAGYEGYSPVFYFAPEGLTFARPATVNLPFTGSSPSLASIFWSREQTTGYDRLGGAVDGNQISAAVSHLSTGFVANGVAYTDPASRDCAKPKVIQMRQSFTLPTPSGQTTTSGLAVFFSVEDCAERPLPDLTPADFRVFEDDETLSVEADPQLFVNAGSQSFVRILVDRSSSTWSSTPEILSGVRTLVTKLMVEQPQLNVQTALDVFAGSNAPVAELQKHTLDPNELLGPVADGGVGAIDRITSWRSTDFDSTNLYGAIQTSLNSLANAEGSFEGRNQSGVFTSGYLVVFTDGTDTAGLSTLQSAVSAIQAQGAKNRVIVVGLNGSGDYDVDALSQLASGGKYLSNSARLDTDVQDMANKIAGRLARTYVLGYCSPKRSGNHKVRLAVTGSDLFGDPVDFSANGFGPGCSSEAFKPEVRCANMECGGLGCGSCDDRTSFCSAGKCQSYCRNTSSCGGTVITNPLGYRQTCADVPNATSCTGVCVDLMSDVTRCGSCTNACPAGNVCSLGECIAPIDAAATVGSQDTMAAGGGNVYWGSSAVRRSPADGSNGTNLVTATIGKIAANSTMVVWSEASTNRIGMAPFGSTTPLTPIQVNTAFGPIAVDDNSAFWITQGAQPFKLFQQSLSSGSGTFFTLPNLFVFPTSMVAAGGAVYFGTPNNYDALYRTNPVTGASDRVTDNAAISRLTADATRVLWTNASGVFSIPQSSSYGATWLTGVEGGSPQGGLASDGVNVYWASGTVIWKMPVNGSARPVEFAKGFTPTSLTVDGTNVYWVSGGKLFKHAK